MWLALAAGMWIYSYRFDGEFPAYLWGPVSWPRAVLVAIVVLAVAQLLLRTVLAPRSEPPAAQIGVRTDDGAGEDATTHDTPQTGPGPAAARPGTSESRGGGAEAQLRILATFTLPLLYLYLLPHTGYFATTPLFLVAYMLAFRERSLKYMLATTALLYAGSLAIFSKLLFVPLPTGNWPGFYDFSNRLLVILDAI